MKKLTQDIVNYFKVFDPSSVLTLLQLKSYYFCKITRLLGIPNIIDTVHNLEKVMEDCIKLAEADPQGNYVSRGLAEIQKNGDSLESVFNIHDGKRYLLEQLIDIFVAGDYETVVILGRLLT